MTNGEKFCLRWNDFENNISSSFQELREDKDFFDVTLACDDNQLQAHKVILSACSPFFRSVLKKNPHQHPLLYLKGVKYEDIVSVLNFMYHGEVNVAQEELNSFLAVAEDLQVKGLTQKNDKQPQPAKPPSVSNKRPQEHWQPPPPVKVTKPPKSNMEKTGYDHTMPRAESYQPRREVQDFAPLIKTESPVVFDCEEVPEESHEMVAADEYQADYAYDESFQEQTMLYQAGHVEMNMGHSAGDGEHEFEDFVNKNSSKVPDSQGTGMQCHLCNKITTHIGNMKQHFEVHHYNRAYKCEVCMKDFRTKNSLDVHKRRHGHYV